MRTQFVVGAVVLSLLLAGCAPASSTPSSTPEPSSSATESPRSSPEPTTEPEVESLTIPECERLLPLALAKTLFSDSTEFFGERSAVEYPSHFNIVGVPEALVSAESFRGCSWVVPNSDGSFALAVASITADTRTAVQAALTTTGFSSVTMGTLTAFEFEAEGMVSMIGATYLFTGDVMIVCDGAGIAFTGAVAGSALDGMRVANPTLSL